MASAMVSVCVRVRSHRVTPSSPASAAARPLTTRRGAPSALRTTSTSCQSMAPRPTPIAFITASLAAKRAAKRSAGSLAASA